jgi:hypothetical protein
MPRYNALAGQSIVPKRKQTSETPLSLGAAKVPEGMFIILTGHPEAGAHDKARFVEWCRNPAHQFADWRAAWKAYQEEKAQAKNRRPRPNSPSAKVPVPAQPTAAPSNPPAAPGHPIAPIRPINPIPPTKNPAPTATPARITATPARSASAARTAAAFIDSL